MRRGPSGAFQMNEQTALDLFSALLNLSDSQQQQLRTIFDAAVKTAAPASAQIQASGDALFEAVKSGKGDDQIKSLAEQQGSLRSQLLVLQVQTFAKMWALLNSAQKSQVDVSMYDDIGEFLSNTSQAILPGTAPASNPGH